MNKTAKERLLKLAEHLEKGQLGHDEFYFGTYSKIQKNPCKTLGCAIGECPTVFPRSWVLVDDENRRQPFLKRRSKQYISSDAMNFFNLTKDEFNHLFLPDYQEPEKFGGKYLTNNATKEEVAANIKAFVEGKEGKS